MTVINVNLSYSKKGDDTLMNHFIDHLLERCTHIAKQTNTFHPFIFQNHAGEHQDVFAGYSEENRRKLLDIQHQIDPNLRLQKLQPGYFKLDRSRIAPIPLHEEL